MNCPEELRRRYLEGRVVPFVGAGVSMSVSWETEEGIQQRGPSWSELTNMATKILGFEDPELARVRGSDLQILEYFKRKHSGQTARLTNWLSCSLRPPDYAITSAPILSALTKLEKCGLFYTTNYDDFLERAFGLHGRETHVVAVEAHMSGAGNATEIVKFHGDLNHPDQIVLTESDYQSRLALESPLDYRLLSDLLGRVVLFVGYSFSDPNVSYLFRLFTSKLVGSSGSLSGPRAYIILRDPSEFEYELFQARKIQIIPVDSEKSTEQIKSVIEEMGRR